jgi:nucleotidyltransferase/DNA polymerase involved in DNA repair
VELGHQVKDITENPYLGDLVAAVSEHRGTGILNSSSSCRDVEKLTSMRTAVCETSERLVYFRDHLFDFVGKIRKGLPHEINVSCKLGVPIFALTQ